MLLLLASALAAEWTPVAPGTHGSISGLVVESPTTVLVVHDTKDPHGTRLSRVPLGGDPRAVVKLQWAGGPAIDLEAIAAIPDTTGRYVAMASRGLVHLLTVEGNLVRVDRVAAVPGASDASNIESFALVRMDGLLVAVWAERGGADGRAEVAAAGFDVGSGAFGAVVRSTLIVPPRPDLRPVSDLAVDPSGALLASFAVDPSDVGPFSSGVYVVGVVSVLDGLPALRLSPSPTPLLVEPTHKIEALALPPGGDGGLWLASDDELFGGWLRAPDPP